MSASAPRLRFLGVAVAEYEQPGSWPPLPAPRGEVTQLRDALNGADVAAEAVFDPTIAKTTEVLLALSEGAGDWRGDRLVVWAGHGAVDDTLRLVLRDTAAQPSDANTLEAARLVSAALAGGADQLLVVLDTCYSGGGLRRAITNAIDAIARQTFPPGSEPWVGIVAATDAHGLLDDKQSVARLLHKLLVSGPDEPTREWSPHEAYIDGPELLRVIAQEWPTDLLPERVTFDKARTPRPLVRNPRFDPAAPDRVLAPPAERRFVGRSDVLRRMAEWAAANPSGLLSVVGSPGLGKSTLLGRFASLADAGSPVREEHAVADELPPARAPVVAVSATRRTAGEAAASLAERLGVAHLGDADALADELRETGSQALLVVDAIDEALPGEAERILAEVVRPLAAVVQVVVASRPIRVDSHPIDALLGDMGVVIDLDADTTLESDLRRFVLGRLTEGSDGDV